MLINCPECNKEISDKAIFCPNCGFPLKKQTSYRRASQNRYKKLPNGFGSIKHLSGKRRKPYACYPPTKGWVIENGKSKAVIPKAIGYFATYNEAYSALCDYNKTPYDTDARSAKFSEVYELFYEEKFGEGRKKLSDSTRKNIEFAYKLCPTLHNRVFTSITREDLQEILDTLEKEGKKYVTLRTVKSFFTQVYKYAISYDIANKNFGSLIVIKKDSDIESGVPFTENDIKILWKDSENSVVSRISLIMIYSGLRIKEVAEASEIDLEQGAFIGGVKTKSGKNRIVPFHSKIEEFIPDLIEYRTQYKDFSLREQFSEKMDELNLNKGDIKHTPHDCRHTFSWLADKYELNEFSKHLLMGHSLGRDVEKAVYGHRTFEELKNEIEKIKI